MKIFMDIVDFLQPAYVLMENVLDYLKFCGGVLARHAMARYLSMGYQVLQTANNALRVSQLCRRSSGFLLQDAMVYRSFVLECSCGLHYVAGSSQHTLSQHMTSLLREA